MNPSHIIAYSIMNRAAKAWQEMAEQIYNKTGYKIERSNNVEHKQNTTESTKEGKNTGLENT